MKNHASAAPKADPPGRGSGIVRRDESSLAPQSDFTANYAGLKPRKRVMRRVTIGKKSSVVRKSQGGGTWRAPEQLDYIRVTLMAKDEKDDYLVDKEFHREFGDKPREIPITLVYDRIGLNIHCYYGLYQGRQAWCRGNGDVGQRLIEKGKPERNQVDCTCPHFTDEGGKCKRHLTFYFSLPGMGTAEVAKFSTTGFYSSSYILGGLMDLKERVGMMLGVAADLAPIAGIPLFMKFGKESINTKDGPRTIPVVSVTFQGSDSNLYDHVKKRQDFLRKTGEYIGLGRVEAIARQNARQLLIEQEVAKGHLAIEDPDTVKEIQEEFHPDEADNDEPIAMPSSDEMISKAEKALKSTSVPSMGTTPDPDAHEEEDHGSKKASTKKATRSAPRRSRKKGKGGNSLL